MDEKIQFTGLRDRLKVTVIRSKKGVRLQRSEYLYLSASMTDCAAAIRRLRAKLDNDYLAVQSA